MTTVEEDLRADGAAIQEASELRAALARERRVTEAVRAELGLAQRIDASEASPPRWALRGASRKHHVAMAVAQLTDTHFDEVIKPEEVGFYNAYDRRIAELRLHRWADGVIRVGHDYVAGVELEGLAVFATGDIFSGDIHAELKESNEDHLYSSVVHWTEQIIAALTLLADGYGRVHVAAVVGNHGRSTVKPVYKGRARSNVEWLMWRGVAQRLAADKRLTFQVGDGMDLRVDLMGTRYLLTHGDQFHGGSGISGAMAPLMLGVHRKNLRQGTIGDPIDIMVMGHFHQLLTLPGLIVGGSMKGLDEFAYGINVRPEIPQQAFWLQTPEHGITVHAPILVSDRKSEGW